MCEEIRIKSGRQDRATLRAAPLAYLDGQAQPRRRLRCEWRVE